MRTYIALVAVGMTAAIAPSTPALAKSHTACEKAYGVRQAVIKKHGRRAPGRNICRFGVKHSDGTVTRTTYRQKKRYLTQLRLLNGSYAYLRVRAVTPRLKPAGTLSAALAPTGQAACIVQRESGGNPAASNGTHFGIAQWSLATWRAHHGPEMTGASDPRGASKPDQLRVLNRALATVGSGDWSPYDGC
jgi:hypothetical protein